jgi:hypothetical protein
MNFKSFLIFLVMTMPCIAHAQDKIYKRDGSIVDAKVKSVGVKNITYARFDNQSGPEYIVSKSDVEKIMYQNGTVDVFEEGQQDRSFFPPPHPHRYRSVVNDTQSVRLMGYKPNVLSLAPIQFTENGLGIGVSYERAIDKNGLVAFYVPLILTWDLSSNTYDNTTGTEVNGHNDLMFYAMPGIKIYPTGSYGIVKYAIGPSLVIATGQRSTQSYEQVGGIGVWNNVTQPHDMLGILINNSLNINPTRHLYLGLDFGFGFTYLNRINGLNQGTQGLVQGGFKVGFRF